MKKNFKVALIALLTIILSPSVISAADDTTPRTFTIVPPTVQLQGKPGDRLETKLKVRNETDSVQTYSLFIRDFIVEDTNGTPKILAPDVADNRWTASKWMAVGTDTLTVPPRTAGETMLYLQIPGNATFGGHYAAVMFQPSSMKEDIAGAGASIITQSASLVYVNVQGPIKENAIVSLFKTFGFAENGPVKINTAITNLGDLHIKPLAQIEIKDLFGKTLTTLPLKEQNIFPGVPRTYENVWQKKWLAGRFTADLVGTYGQNGLPLSAQLVFYVFPIKIVLAILLAIVIIVLLVKFFQKKSPPPPKFSQETEEK